MFQKNDSSNEVLKAYVDFVASVQKTNAEVYAKTWQDVTKFNEVVAKSLQDVWSDTPVWKSVSNLWDTYVPTKKGK